jgi:hypothetical protein
MNHSTVVTSFHLCILLKFVYAINLQMFLYESQHSGHYLPSLYSMLLMFLYAINDSTCSNIYKCFFRNHSTVVTSFHLCGILLKFLYAIKLHMFLYESQHSGHFLPSIILSCPHAYILLQLLV